MKEYTDEIDEMLEFDFYSDEYEVEDSEQEEGQDEDCT